MTVDVRAGGVGVREEQARRAHRREVRVLADRLRSRLLGDTACRVRVGRYQLRRRIGRGAMATVFEAFDERLERTVAVKFIHPDQLGSARGEARLLREARALARLSHPNIVAIHDAGEEDGELYLVMELLSAGTLGQWQAEMLRTPEALLDVYLGVGEGLQAAHEAGVWHRDVKPANVVLERGGTPKLVDFGLAALAPVESPSAGSVALTQSGTTLGTRGYMAPEQAAGQPADARSDQFSFCAALHEALLEGSTSKTVPPTIGRVLERGMAQTPGDRWPSMAALLRELRRARPKAHEPAAPQLPVGMDFPVDRYLFVEPIGEGASSVVVLAQHRTLHHRVAIKLLRPGLCEGPREERLLHEARLIATLHHPNIVRVHDAGFTPAGTPYLEMEYLPGEDLATRLERCGPRPWSEVREIGISVAKALVAVHALQVVHRDVKPSNCRRVPQGDGVVVKLLDFGVAFRARGRGAGLGAPVGTPMYMAPEQLTGGKQDHRVDIYALGVMLYELLTGVLPHQASTPATLAQAKTSVPVVSPCRFSPDVPRAAEAFLGRALASDPDQRFASMEALLGALEATPRARGRRRWWPRVRAIVAASSLAVLMMLAAGSPVVSGVRVLRSGSRGISAAPQGPGTGTWIPRAHAMLEPDPAPQTVADGPGSPERAPSRTAPRFAQPTRAVAMPAATAASLSAALRHRCQLYAYPRDEAALTLTLGPRGNVRRVAVRGVKERPLGRCLETEGETLWVPPELGTRVSLRVTF